METGFKRETWKVGWTCMAGGSLSVTAEGLMTETIGKGPTKQGVNFLEPVCKGLTHPIRSGSPVAISNAAVLLCGAQQSGACVLPRPAATAEMVLDRGDGDVILLSRKQGWLVSQGAFKRGHAGGSTGHGIVGILDPREMVAPSRGVARSHTTQRGSEILIGSQPAH